MASILKIAISPKTLDQCKGYDPEFTGTHIGMGTILDKSRSGKLPDLARSSGLLHYTDLSVAYNTERKLPFFAAYNVDGAAARPKVRRTDFSADPRISEGIQLNKAFYDLRTDIVEFEIGHMAASREMAWGRDAQIKAYQTFFYPNSSPQAENLNTGIWKSLETYIINEAIDLTGNKRIAVFAGPVLRDDDPLYKWDRSFKIPLLFFKVVVFPMKSGTYSTAFVMSHEQKMIEQGMFADTARVTQFYTRAPELPFSDFKYRKVFQVNIDLLENLGGLKFDWDEVKRVAVPNQKNQIEKIRKIKDAGDAKAAEDLLRKGVIPARYASSAVSLLTEQEIRSKNYRLNIILP